MSNNSNDDTDSLEEYEYFEDFNDKLQPQVAAARPSQTGRSVSLPAITSASNSSHSANTQTSNGNKLLKIKTSSSVNNNNKSMQVEDLEDLDLKRQVKTGVSYASKPGQKIQTLPTKALPSSSTSSTSTSTSASSPAASSSSAAASPAGGKTGKLCCDKCDGNHETDACPYYKKSRDSHPDAQKNFYKKMGGTSKLPGSMIRLATVVRQPGDGSCLFHSMSYGLKDGCTAATLRSEICQFIAAHPNLKICETPLSDWVKWDSNQSCSEYAKKMSRGSWGGGIEMACVSNMKRCNVHVYEKSMTGYKRISAFDYPSEPETRKTIRVLYCGGVHYDALVTSL
jgi:hypothetical protein